MGDIKKPILILIFIIVIFSCASVLAASATVITCADTPCYQPEKCLNKSGMNATCICGDNFIGDRCDVVRLKKIPEWNIGTKDVTFTWLYPIVLQGYRAALYEKYTFNPEKSLTYYSIADGNYSSLTFGGLKSGQAYVVCIVTVDEIEKNNGTGILFNDTFDKNRDCCFSFITSYHGSSPQTIAAVVLSIIIGVIVVIVLLFGVIKACLDTKKARMKETYAEKPPSRTSSKRSSKRSVRPRTGSVKKTAWKYEGGTPTGTPRASRERLDEDTEMGSRGSISIILTDCAADGQQRQVDLTSAINDAASPTSSLTGF